MPEPTSGPLAGLTVIDLTRVLAGPYCTMILADLGARVIKIERPGRGDDARQIGPFAEGGSAYFASLNRGKQSLALDLKDDTDREILLGLLAEADVLVENFRAGAMERLGLGWEDLHARFPRLIYAAASGFGHTGPYADRPAYDMVVQAMGGIMSLTGEEGGPPTRVGTSIGDLAAGLFTAIGVNTALYHRERTGEGLKIDVSMLDCQVALLENAIARYGATGEVPGPIGARHPSITPFGRFATGDEPLVIAAGNDALFRSLCRELDRADLAARPEFASNALRTRNCDALKGELEAALASAPRDTWLERLHRAGIPCGPLQDVADVMNDPQVAARNMIIETPGDRGLRMAGNPIKLSGFDDPAVRSPAPELDADRPALLKPSDEPG
ncbi:MAG: CoA transferase [Myxococcota bacterium]|nr:CoA transferase [Myxococcota bacterium]